MKKTTKKILYGVTALAGLTVAGVKVATAMQKKQCTGDEKNPFEGKKVIFVKDEEDPENADGVRGHLEPTGNSDYVPSFYNKYVKRCFDIVLSFGGIVVLSPVLLGIAAAIKIDDPGPVFFTQKRLGQNKKYFRVYKFRSMKMSTPHDTPTHMLENPEQYITRVGKFLRAHSLDELPQLFNVLDGSLSLVGPRPGLWNQDVLAAEREKYGVNEYKPGITGWAQINGRDSISIEKKSELDGYGVKHSSPLFDLKCLLGTVTKVGHDDTVVEGGTGAMAKACRNYTEGKTEKELIGNIGFGEAVEVDKGLKKRVLITGAGSYIGQSFIAYAKKYYPENFEIDELDMIGDAWKEYNFSQYDIIYHVAGIAHADVGNVSDETKEKYYQVNTDLTIEVAKKAKEENVKEFIFMSSMIVYGESAPYGKEKIVDEHTVPAPANFYGDSKLQADVAVRELADDNFKVIVLRPPMIYGKGSKGNYPVLAKLAKKLPVFPDVDNKRSMLYIENLCEFLCQVMLIKKYSRDAIVLFPQNKEWVKIGQMVRNIAAANGKTIWVTSVMKPAVVVGGIFPGKIGRLTNKAFGCNCYEHRLSIYDGIEYQRVDLKKSIVGTEKDIREMKKTDILFSAITICYNSESVIRKTIESVLNQTYPNIEYIIIDGDSTDRTVEIAKEYTADFINKGYSYKIYSEKDNGIYDGMNKGINRATGKLIGLINSGDWYEPQMVMTAVDTYVETGYDMFYANINLVKENGSIIVKRSKKDIFPTSRHWNHPTTVVTKSLYEELGTYKCQGIHDDFDFLLRVKKAGKKIVIKNLTLANFVVGGTSNEKSIQKCKRRCVDRYRCYRNNGYGRYCIIECILIEVIKFIIA